MSYLGRGGTGEGKREVEEKVWIGGRGMEDCGRSAEWRKRHGVAESVRRVERGKEVLEGEREDCVEGRERQAGSGGDEEGGGKSRPKK